MEPIGVCIFEILLRLQIHHHRTQAAARTTLQTSLAMDPEEKKQVQSIIDRFKGHFLPDGGEIVGSINSSSSEFAMNIIAHIVREHVSGSIASDSMKAALQHEFGFDETKAQYSYPKAKFSYPNPYSKADLDFFDCLLHAVGYWCAVVVCKLSVFPVYLYISLDIYLLDSKVPPPPEAQYPYPNQYPYPYPYQYPNPPENLEQYFGHKRADAAAILGVSVSTFKRMCKQKGINPWPYQYRKGSSGSVSKPPDQHGERNTSTACETPSHNVQTGMEGELFGQNEGANVLQRDFMGGPNALDTESVSRPPDQHGERNTSTACETPSHNVENEMGCQNSKPNEFQPDSFADLNLEEFLSDCDYLALGEEPSLEGLVFGSVSLTVAACSDPAPCQHPMPTIPDTMTTTHMMPHLAAKGDVRFVTLKVTYGKKIIKFQFPLMSGIIELKEEVKKRLKLELDSFDIEYKDEDGDCIFLGCDEDLRNHLQLFSNQVIRLLVVDSDANTANFR